MRILQLTRDYSHNGGIGSYARDLTALLGSSGHQVAVIFSQGETDSSEKLLHRVPAFDEFRPRHALALRRRVLALAEGFGPDVIFVHAMDDYELERALRSRHAVARFVHNHQYCSSGIDHAIASLKPCLQPQGPACVAGFMLRRCWRVRNPVTALLFYRRARAAVRSLRKADVLFAGSRYVRERIARNGVDRERVILAPYFPGLPGMPEESPRLGQAGGTLLFVGRLVPEKGLDRLLLALRGLPGSWRLIVNGSGPRMTEAIALTQSLGLAGRVRYLGWTDRVRLAECYQTADIVVVPSLWPEPFGLVGIEAMAYVKPVVAFRSGAIPEWLQDGVTGYVVEPGDVAALGRRISELLADPHLRLRMGLAGRARVRRDFSPSRHFSIIMEGLETAIERRESRSPSSRSPRPGRGCEAGQGVLVGGKGRDSHPVPREV